MENTLIGAPLQIGAGQLGCEMGPSALLVAGLRAALARQCGDLLQDASLSF